MDREKVINAFKERISSCSIIGDGFDVTINWKLADDVLALLKEQEPVAVYESKISRCACGNTVNRYWHPKFCAYCGKELVWY